MRNGILFSIVAASIILVSTQCRKPDTAGGQQVILIGDSSNYQYLDLLQKALDIENQALRQTEEHARKFDLTWPYTTSQKAARMRITKIEAKMREKGQNPGYNYFATSDADSIEDALEMDAELYATLIEYYKEVIASHEATPDYNVFNSLLGSARRHQRMLLHHNGIPPDKLREYGRNMHNTSRPGKKKSGKRGR